LHFRQWSVAHHQFQSCWPGGPGTVFLYHQDYDHSTLYINNDNLESDVGMIKDYNDLTEDSFKAWILPNAGKHWLAEGNYDFRFEELQIYVHVGTKWCINEFPF
jgi:hypothetical protein